jgi:hypothetical protein
VAAYLTISEFKLRSVMPGEMIDEIEARQPGWVDAQLETWSRWMDSRLAKRYAVPFLDPIPETVKVWLAQVVTPRAFLRRGVVPTDEQQAMIFAELKSAEEQIKEAADSNEGLFDLPIKELAPWASGISKGGPFGYAEHSPYVQTDIQVQLARNEDINHRGS